MEKGINYAQVADAFGLKGRPAGEYSPLTLAYLGDAVYELYIRSIVTGRADTSADKLTKRGAALCNASAQSAIIRLIEPELSEDEASAFRRGKNARPHSVAKGASLSDYHRATGLEALCGYLYLSGRSERLLQLLRKGIDGFEGRTGTQEPGSGKASREGGMPEDSGISGGTDGIQ